MTPGPVGAVTQATGSPDGLSSQVLPAPCWTTERLPAVSIAIPSGPPLPPWSWTKRPTLNGRPSGSKGIRQTAFARVTAT